MTEAEKAALLGEKSTEQVETSKEVVEREEYEKLAQQHANLLSLKGRHDEELHELREKVKAYESKSKASATLDDEDNLDEDAEFLNKLQKYGIKPRSEDRKRPDGAGKTVARRIWHPV